MGILFSDNYSQVLKTYPPTLMLQTNQCHQAIDTIVTTLKQVLLLLGGLSLRGSSFRLSLPQEDTSFYILSDPSDISLPQVFLCQSRVRSFALTTSYSRSLPRQHPPLFDVLDGYCSSSSHYSIPSHTTELSSDPALSYSTFKSTPLRHSSTSDR